MEKIRMAISENKYNQLKREKFLLKESLSLVEKNNF